MEKDYAEYTDMHEEPQPVICTRCGSSCGQDDNYCWKCGNKLNLK